MPGQGIQRSGSKTKGYECVSSTFRSKQVQRTQKWREKMVEQLDRAMDMGALEVSIADIGQLRSF